MEQSRNRLVVDTDTFKQQYHDPSNPALTHDQSQHVFGEYYQISADGTPLLDPRAFEDPRCAKRFETFTTATRKAELKGKAERPKGEKRAILATKLIIGAFVLSWLGSAAYETRDMEDKNPISNPEGYVDVMFTGAVRYFDNYVDMAYIAQGKTPRSELRAQAFAQNSKPLMPAETSAPTSSPGKKPTASSSPSPSKSAEPLPALYPVVDAIKYKTDKQGNLLGMAATYKKKSGLTAEQVTQMETCGNTTDDVVLTFDDPASDKQIDAITNILEKEKVGGVFFVNILDKPKISQNKIDELRKKGFGVASHGGTHADLTKLSDAEIERVIKSGGVATLYRPAYGATYKEKESKNIYFDDRVKKIADNMGKNVCLWTLDTQDWKGKEQVNAKSIVDAVKNNVAARSVILMHARMPETLTALPKVIAVTRSKKLNICTSSGPTSSDFNKTPLCK